MTTDRRHDPEGLYAPQPLLQHQLSLGDISRENRRRFPLRTAMVCGDSRLTYPELDNRITRLANALDAMGVDQGDRVLWAGQNCHRFFELMFACAKIGANVCPPNWRMSPEELAYIVGDFDPKVVFWQEEEIGDRVREARRLAGHGASWVQYDAEGPGTYEALVAGGDPTDDERNVYPFSPVLTIYTAAFAGKPQGALLSHACLISAGLVQGLVMGIDSGADDVLNCGPFFHIGDIVHALPYWHFGGTNVIMRRMDAEEAAMLIEREKITNAYMYGPIGPMIAEAAEKDHRDVSTLRVPEDDLGWRTMSSKGEGSPINGYGQSEVGGRVTFSTFGGEAIGPMGRSSPLAQVRLFDADGREVPTGEVGELAVRGPTVMNGYYGREWPNRQPHGWRRTNDLGRREADGSITFVGTALRMLKSGVENVYPADVEAVIRQHPAVEACALIGLPDPIWAQTVCAIVVVRDGHQVTDQDIMDFCKKRMAGYKKPRTVIFATSIPTKEGFTDYDALDEQYGGGGYPGY